MSYEREQVIDFSIPVSKVRRVLHQHSSARSETRKLKRTAFIDVLRPTSWTMIVAAIILMSGMMAAGEASMARGKMDPKLLHSAMEVLFRVCLPTLVPEKKTEPTQWLKILLFSSAFFMLMLTAVYCGDLTAYLTAEPAGSFENCQDIADAGYKLLIHDGSTVLSKFLKESQPLHGCRDQVRISLNLHS